MPSLLPSRWSNARAVAPRIEPILLNDDDLAIGCEAACPALQFEDWEPAPAAASTLDPSLN